MELCRAHAWQARQGGKGEEWGSLVPPETSGVPWSLSLYPALILRKAQCQDTQPRGSKGRPGNLFSCESCKIKVTSLKMLARNGPVKLLRIISVPGGREVSGQSSGAAWAPRASTSILLAPSSRPHVLTCVKGWEALALVRMPSLPWGQISVLLRRNP